MKEGAMSDWKYEIKFTESVRFYEQLGGGVEKRPGLAWTLERSTPALSQSIVASARVFPTEKEAKQDALVSLSRLRCPLDKPLDER